MACSDLYRRRASQEQEGALITGKQGRPIADLAALVGEVVKVEPRADHVCSEEGKGVLRIGDTTEAEWSPIGGRAVSRPP